MFLLLICVINWEKKGKPVVLKEYLCKTLTKLSHLGSSEGF